MTILSKISIVIIELSDFIIFLLDDGTVAYSGRPDGTAPARDRYPVRIAPGARVVPCRGYFGDWGLN
jgi:hypothetical protein